MKLLKVLCLVGLLVPAQRIGVYLYTAGSGGGVSVLAPGNFSYLGAIRMPTGTDTNFAQGGMGARKVGGHLHPFVYANPVNAIPNPPDLLELDIDGLTPVPPISNINMTGVPRATLVKNWGDIYHGKRLTGHLVPPGDPYVPLTGLAGINHALYWHEGLQQLFWSYDYNYTDSSLATVGFSTLDDLSTGASTAYGPCQYQATSADGPLIEGSRAHYIFAHPTTGKMLMGGVIKSGAASLSYGPNYFGDPDFPTPSTTQCSDTPTSITQAGRYANYYFKTVNYDGSYSGNLTSFRYLLPLTYIYEYFPGTFTDHRVDPTKNSSIGTWGDVDGCQNATWLELTHVHGVMFFCTLQGADSSDPTNPLATHEFYSNQGQWSMYTSSTTGFIPGEPIWGSSSHSRAIIDNVETGVGLGGQQPTGGYTIGETATGLTSTAHGVVSDSAVDTSGIAYIVFSSSSGTFSVGEFVQGGTSGRYMQVTSWNSGTATLVGNEFIEFTDGETVQGQTSMATATISGKPAGVRNSWLRHNLVCVHGHTLPVPVTGPGTTQSTSAIIIYDPAKGDAVKAGSATDWQQDANYIMNLQSLFSLITAPQDDLAAKSIDGYYFDTATNNLYLNAVHADCSHDNGCGVNHNMETLIHVFHINDVAAPVPFPLASMAILALGLPAYVRLRRVA